MTVQRLPIVLLAYSMTQRSLHVGRVSLASSQRCCALACARVRRADTARTTAAMCGLPLHLVYRYARCAFKCMAEWLHGVAYVCAPHDVDAIFAGTCVALSPVLHGTVGRTRPQTAPVIAGPYVSLYLLAGELQLPMVVVACVGQRGQRARPRVGVVVEERRLCCWPWRVDCGFTCPGERHALPRWLYLSKGVCLSLCNSPACCSAAKHNVNKY